MFVCKESKRKRISHASDAATAKRVACPAQKQPAHRHTQAEQDSRLHRGSLDLCRCIFHSVHLRQHLIILQGNSAHLEVQRHAGIVLLDDNPGRLLHGLRPDATLHSSPAHIKIHPPASSFQRPVRALLRCRRKSGPRRPSRSFNLSATPPNVKPALCSISVDPLKPRIYSPRFEAAPFVTAPSYGK